MATERLDGILSREFDTAMLSISWLIAVFVQNMLLARYAHE